MTTLLRRAFSTARVWVGLGEASTARLTPAHGWLLPTPPTLVALREQAVTDALADDRSRPRG